VSKAEDIEKSLNFRAERMFDLFRDGETLKMLQDMKTLEYVNVSTETAAALNNERTRIRREGDSIYSPSRDQFTRALR
jgi:hypothetical protein